MRKFIASFLRRKPTRTPAEKTKLLLEELMYRNATIDDLAQIKEVVMNLRPRYDTLQYRIITRFNTLYNLNDYLAGIGQCLHGESGKTNYRKNVLSESAIILTDWLDGADLTDVITSTVKTVDELMLHGSEGIGGYLSRALPPVVETLVALIEVAFDQH